MTPRPPALAVALAALVLAAALVAAGAGCRGDAAPQGAAGPAEVTPARGCSVVLDGVHEGGLVVVTVNGFPVEAGPGAVTYEGFEADATPALVSGENVVAVRMRPLLGRAGDRLQVGRPSLSVRAACADGSGAALGAGEVSAAHGAWRPGLARRWARWRSGPGALDSARAWAGRHPAVAEARFTRPAGAAPSFDGVFRGGPVIGGTAADSARLRAYAVRLLALTAAQDTAALVDELAPALADRFRYAVHGLDSAAYYGLNRRAVVYADPEPYEAGDVEMTSWAGGRVWGLGRRGEPGLLQDAATESYVEVFVAEVDGRLRVVR